MPCLLRRMRYNALQNEQGITNTSQVICSGNTSAYLPCPGAVAIASVPPPVRPQEMGKGVKISPHWLPRLGMETERKQNPVHSTRCPIVIQTYNGSQGLPMCQASVKKKKHGFTTGNRKVHAYYDSDIWTLLRSNVFPPMAPWGPTLPPTISYRSRLPGSLGAK